MARFSHRTPPSLRPNRLAEARRRAGAVPFDLTESNPTRCELPYDRELLAPLADPRGLVYRPDPRGERAAREAIAAGYREWGLELDPDTVFLTASTSEAYSVLFKLLADPGDAVLVPSPSYPLFEQLSRLEAVEARPYRLDPEQGWRIDRGSIEAAPATTRALVVVHPNNPTGSFVADDDAAWLAATCRRRGWALIADEVFLPYPLDPSRGSRASLAGLDVGLGFALGGLSKSVGLPQLKLGWIVVAGATDEAAAASERLEHLLDALLPVATPVALAAPALLERGRRVQRAIAGRCRANLERLATLVAAVPAVSLRRPEGGWSALLRLPCIPDEEGLALRLLVEEGVAVHPGFFFDLPADGHLVLSLLPPEERFATGVRRLLATVESTLA